MQLASDSGCEDNSVLETHIAREMGFPGSVVSPFLYVTALTSTMQGSRDWPNECFGFFQIASLGDFRLAPTYPIEKVSPWVVLIHLILRFESDEDVAEYITKNT